MKPLYANLCAFYVFLFTLFCLYQSIPVVNTYALSVFQFCMSACLSLLQKFYFIMNVIGKANLAQPILKANLIDWKWRLAYPENVETCKPLSFRVIKCSELPRLTPLANFSGFNTDDLGTEKMRVDGCTFQAFREKMGSHFFSQKRNKMWKCYFSLTRAI